MVENTFFYGGYGANRDAAMLAAVTANQDLIGKPAVFNDVELCIQRFNQIPDIVVPTAPVPKSPKAIMVVTWGINSKFETYTIRPKKGGQVVGCIFELTEQERALIAEWEMIEFGWYKRMSLSATLNDGTIVIIDSEGLADNQEIDRAVDGMNYPTYLNDPSKMFKVAEKAREDYILRQEKSN